jgi:hypothetical protein
MGIEVVCFGDFHLDQQMFAKRGSAHFAQGSYADTKVTRPPGRDPARNAVRNTSMNRTAGQRQQWAECRAPLLDERARVRMSNRERDGRLLPSGPYPCGRGKLESISFEPAR